MFTRARRQRSGKRAAVPRLRTLRNGQRLMAPSSYGQQSVSLSGLSAALLLIDSVQGQLEHADALVRVGPLPDSTGNPDTAEWPLLWRSEG